MKILLELIETLNLLKIMVLFNIQVKYILKVQTVCFPALE